VNGEIEQFEPAKPRRRRRHTGRGLLFAGVVLLAAGIGWSACVVALWSWTPEGLVDNGLAVVGCFLASTVCYTLGLASLLAWKNRRQ
jgi:hypothetical protein